MKGIASMYSAREYFTPAFDFSVRNNTEKLMEKKVRSKIDPLQLFPLSARNDKGGYKLCEEIDEISRASYPVKGL